MCRVHGYTHCLFVVTSVCCGVCCPSGSSQLPFSYFCALIPSPDVFITLKFGMIVLPSLSGWNMLKMMLIGPLHAHFSSTVCTLLGANLMIAAGSPLTFPNSGL